MILHFLTDDKFTDYVVKQFSAPEMHSLFVIVTSNPQLTYFRQNTSFKTISPYSDEFHAIIAGLSSFKAIVLHGLFYPWQQRVLSYCPNTVKVAWVFWGGDIYGRKDLSANYLSSSSKKLLLKQQIKRAIKHRKPTKYEIPYELLNRIDYCLTDIPEDFDFVKKYLRTNIKELWYNYYSVEETIGVLKDARCNGNNILLGNSCTIECNHLDGFRAIQRMRLNPDSRIYVPLSYGEAWLRKQVLKKGKRVYKDKFVPLTDFLSRNVYNQIIQSCSVAIMPHYRPQAFGNILTALWLGTKVYMSKKNPLFSFFKRIGTIVFSMEEDLKYITKESLLPLSDEETSQNRTAISALYSKEEMGKKNKLIVQILDS